MSDHALESDFMRMKSEVLDEIQKTKEKWQLAWREAQGNPAAENSLIHLNLEIQVMEARALEKLGKLEEKIKQATRGERNEQRRHSHEGFGFTIGNEDNRV